MDKIPLSKSINDLVGGKSTLQNEILSDLQQEFALAPEKGEELPLEELSSALGSGFSYTLGMGLISHLIGGKNCQMPDSFNLLAIKSYLSKSWGLGSSHSDGILLLGTILEPPNDLLPKWKGKVGLMALFLSMRNVLAFHWHLRQALEVHLEVVGRCCHQH